MLIQICSSSFPSRHSLTFVVGINYHVPSEYREGRSGLAYDSLNKTSSQRKPEACCWGMGIAPKS